MKCDECLLKHKAKWAGSDDDWCSANHYSDDEWIPCHLTPDHQRFINAMIRGVFCCDGCKFIIYRNALTRCSFEHRDWIIECSDKCFCFAWQERKEVGDG